MLIGAMNHPGHPILEEIEWMAALGLDFIDLTLEPPMAAVWSIDVPRIRDALAKSSLRAVGHTAYYLPFACPFESVRRAAVDEARRCIEVFGKLGISWMNFHPDRHTPMHSAEFMVERNVTSIQEMLVTARDCGVGLMLENLPGDLSTVTGLSKLLDPVPEVGLHLDIGHSNLMLPENTADELIRHFSARLRHVHLHDNRGGHMDLHLPLGVGNINVERHVRTLKASGYDQTITLEVFAPDRTYLAHSRDLLRRIWDAAPGPKRPELG